MKVIEQYLVSLGFTVDRSMIHNFTKALMNGKLSLGLLAAAAEGLTIAFSAMVVKIAEGQRELEILARNTTSTVESITKLEYIASMTGSSIEAAKNSFQGLADTMGAVTTGNEEAASTFQALGINIFTAGNHLKSVNEVMGEIGRQIRGFDRLTQINFLRKFGIDPSMINALTTNVAALSKEFDAIQKAAGLNRNSLAVQSEQLVNSWTRLKLIIQTLGLKIVADSLKEVQRFLNTIGDFLLHNLKGTATFISTIINGFLKLTDIILDFFKHVSMLWNAASSDMKLLTVQLLLFVGALLYGKRALAAFNIVFAIFEGLMDIILSPIFLTIAGIILLIAAIDDLYVYMKGGNSIIGEYLKPLQDRIQWLIDHLQILGKIGKSIFGGGDPGTFSVLDYWVPQTTTASSMKGVYGPSLPGGGTVINQDNRLSLTVSGAGDPHAVAHHVVALQNKQRVRHGGSVIR